jgi:hypothetical protein
MRSLSLTTGDMEAYPGIAPKFGQIFKNITKFELNIKLIAKEAVKLINYFPHLRETSFQGYKSTSIYNLVQLYWYLPYRIQRINLKSHLVINNIRMFNLFTYYYQYKATTLNIKFLNNSVNYDLNFIEDCVQNLKLFKQLRYLKIESPIDYQQYLVLTTLKKLKYMQLANVRNKYVNRILTNISTLNILQSFIMFSTLEPITVNTEISANIRSVRTGLIKVAKCGHFYVNLQLVNMNNYVFLPKSKFLLMSLDEDIDHLFKNVIFDSVQYFVFISVNPNTQLYAFLKFNSSITTIIMEEKHITQELIDLFKTKSFADPKRYYSIGVLSVDQPYKFRILLNFSVHLNTRYIFNYKISE